MLIAQAFAASLNGAYGRAEYGRFQIYLSLVLRFERQRPGRGAGR